MLYDTGKHCFYRNTYIKNLYPTHTKVITITHGAVLRGVGCDVLEGPLQVLVAGQLPCECAGLGAAESQQAVVGGQRAPVEQHHLVVVVVPR